MDTTTRGRHRRAPARRGVPLAATVVGAVLLVAAAVSVTAWLGSRGDTSGPTAEPTTTSTVTERASPTESPVTLTGTRDVRVDGDVVTVVEDTTVADGDGVVVRPATHSTDPALQLTAVDVVAGDGTLTTFDSPVTLTSGRSLTVQGTYRLRDCPDLLPVDWPSPTEVVGRDWARTWTRSSEPLRTAPTLCKGKPSSAPMWRELSARLVTTAAGTVPGSVRIVLGWTGTPPLVVDDVGALSDLAGDTVLSRSPLDGCPDTGCIGTIRGPGLVLEVRPVEACPDPAPRPDRLTLVVRPGDGRTRVVGVAVPGLGRWLDSRVCR